MVELCTPQPHCSHSRIFHEPQKPQRIRALYHLKAQALEPFFFEVPDSARVAQARVKEAFGLAPGAQEVSVSLLGPGIWGGNVWGLGRFGV